MSAVPRPEAAPGAPRARGMRADDLDAVAAIERAIYPFPWTRGNFSDSLEAGYDGWIFEDPEGASREPLGYAIVMWLPEEAHLLNFSVAGPLQGRGIGGRMLDWLLDDVRRRGAFGMMLEVRPSNAPALALYRRAGFAQLGVRKGYYPAGGGTREDAWVLFRTLRRE